MYIVCVFTFVKICNKESKTCKSRTNLLGWNIKKNYIL